MNDSILTSLLSDIDANGPMTIADYMGRCLSHYYAHNQAIGATGDFTTAPEISQMFGEIIGAWVMHVHETMGAPDAFNLVELGPGRGTLSADMMRLAALRPSFLSALTLHLVETSPALREKQRAALGGNNVVWHETIDTLPSGPTIIIANEFFDALPVRQYVYEGDVWRERAIIRDGDDLSLTSIDMEGDDLLPDEADDGAIAEIHETGAAIANQLAKRIASQGGALLAIDYGYSGPAFGDSLQAVKDHQYAPVLEAPGLADLTTHVDFTQLAGAVIGSGARFAGPITQGEFLSSLGIAARAEQLKAKNPDQRAAIEADLARLVSPDAMGALFKVCAISHPDIPLPPPFGLRGAGAGSRVET